jgi:hypothetical protein
MGSIVQDSAPYLFPFIIEYSLIGAAVIYVMWRHIGRSPRSAILLSVRTQWHQLNDFEDYCLLGCHAV